MGKVTCFGFFAVLALTLPFTAQAQHAAAPSAPASSAAPATVSHAPAATSSGAAAHAHHIVPRGSGTVTRSPNGNHGGTNTAGGTASNPNVVVLNADSLASLDLTGQVPGLGFDYEHLAAISGNLAEKALIDPATQAELALLARFNRGAFAPEYFLWDYPYSESEPTTYDNSDPQPQTQSTPQIVIVQTPAAAPGAQAYGQGEASADLQTARPALPDASDFLLVLKNGVMVSAVAFTRKGDQLIYVTKEGNRRTMDMASIDADATSKVNAARGTPLKLEI